LSRKILALVLAGGGGEGLGVLCKHRSPSAVPYGGKYRIIDFVLSNLANSGIYQVDLITQYAPVSLHHHIGIGRPWGLDRKQGSVRILHPYSNRRGFAWYQGTGDALVQNLSEIEESQAGEVLVVFADEIYKMDYGELEIFHLAANADLTIGITKVAPAEASRLGMVKLDSSGRVIEFEEKPKDWDTPLACMGLYLFKKEILVERLTRRKGVTDLVYDIIKPMVIERRPVFGFRFDAYWREVGHLDSYFKSNMELLALRPRLDLYDRRWPVYTRSEGLPPARLAPGAAVRRSIVADGCDIAGRVENSVLFPGVSVAAGAVVKDSIVMNSSRLLKGCSLDRAVLDKAVVVGEDARIGTGKDFSSLREGVHELHSGISVIGKQTCIPRGLSVGRNCVVDSGLKESDFAEATVPSGSWVAGEEETA